MAKKMFFNRTVKYSGEIYAPNVIFEVQESDVEELRKIGGFIKEEPVSKKTLKVDVKVEAVAPEKSDLELLREKAAEMGIKYPSNWGVKKLEYAIKSVLEESEEESE